MAEAAGTGGLLKEFCDETSCSICLEYFRDPVILDCGHNFCRACLTQCWRESGKNFSCPQCRETILQRNFRPNRQLANIVALIKKLEEEKRAEGNWGQCGKHLEPLKLFCKEDDAPICLVCDRSKEHQDHSVVPAEDAAREYKIKIQAQLQTLEKERELLVGQKQAEEQRSQKCLAQLGAEKQKFRSAFEQMEKFLQEKKSFWLVCLGDLEKEMEEKQKENIASLSGEISSLSNLIAEMEGKCQQPANKFLQDIRSTLTRCQKGQGRQLKLYPDLEERLRTYCEKHSVLKETMEKCQESLEQAQKTAEDLEQPMKKVNVTLDADTAHPSLVLSLDLKSVRREKIHQGVPDNPERFDRRPFVLGRERFTSGRHCWEVEVEMGEEDSAAWAVGVARESVRRKGQTCLDPKEGIWAVGKDSSFPPQAWAFTSPKSTRLTLRNFPRKIRVFLNYEEGCVEFFDADTDNSIFTFCSASFSGKGVRPFFWVWSLVTLKCSFLSQDTTTLSTP